MNVVQFISSLEYRLESLVKTYKKDYENAEMFSFDYGMKQWYEGRIHEVCDMLGKDFYEVLGKERPNYESIVSKPKKEEKGIEENVG